MGSFIIFVLAIIAMFAVAIMRMNQEDDGPDPDPFSKDSATRPSRTSGGASPARRRPVPRTSDTARAPDTARTADTDRTAGLASAASALAAAAARGAVEARSPAPEAPQSTDLSAPESEAPETAEPETEAPAAAAPEAAVTEAAAPAPDEPAAEQTPTAGTSSGAFYTSSSSSYSVYTPTSVYQSGSSVLKEDDPEDGGAGEMGESSR